MTYYAAFLRTRDKSCVMIGGGAIATRRCQALIQSGANLIVISPTLTPPLQSLVSDGLIHHEARPYQRDDLAGAWLVFAATNHPAVNAAVAAEAHRLGILCNRADDASACDFIVPSSIVAGPIEIALSTLGASPATSKRLREAFEADMIDGGNTFMTLLRSLPQSL